MPKILNQKETPQTHEYLNKFVLISKKLKSLNMNITFKIVLRSFWLKTKINKFT